MGINKGTCAGLNQDGRKKVREFIDMLHKIDDYRECMVYTNEYDNSEVSELRRPYMKLYDLPAAAGNRKLSR